MPLPKAPPAAAAAPSPPSGCGICGEEARETESDLVEIFCNQGDCVDAAGRRYHRDCMRDHIDKTGRVRKTHGGINDLRQIQRMELTGAPSEAHWTLSLPRPLDGPAERRTPQASTACTLTAAPAPRAA